MGFKDYDAMLAEKIGGRPTFKVGGQMFTCRAKLPWKKFSALLLSLTVTSATGDTPTQQTEEFFRLVLLPNQREAFQALLDADGEDDDETPVIDSNQVGYILDDLLAYYTGKAQPNDSVSTEQQQNAGQPSNVTSLTPREGIV